MSAPSSARASRFWSSAGTDRMGMSELPSIRACAYSCGSRTSMRCSFSPASMRSFTSCTEISIGRDMDFGWRPKSLELFQFFDQSVEALLAIDLGEALLFGGCGHHATEHRIFESG